MDTYGVPPNVVTYNSLIAACGKCGRPNEAIALFSAMKDVGLVPDVITFSALISACDASQLDEALEVYDEMKTCGVALDAQAYNAVISVCLMSGSADRAVTVFREMQAAGVRSCLCSSLLLCYPTPPSLLSDPPLLCNPYFMPYCYF
jgi:pentatricopeptide repeat domain-containing protein 1